MLWLPAWPQSAWQKPTCAQPSGWGLAKLHLQPWYKQAQQSIPEVILAHSALTCNVTDTAPTPWAKAMPGFSVVPRPVHIHLAPAAWCETATAKQPCARFSAASQACSRPAFADPGWQAVGLGPRTHGQGGEVLRGEGAPGEPGPHRPLACHLLPGSLLLLLPQQRGGPGEVSARGMAQTWGPRGEEGVQAACKGVLAHDLVGHRSQLLQTLHRPLGGGL